MNIEIGKRFGKLVSVKEVDPYILPSGQKNRVVLCKCDCGNTKKVRLLHWKRGLTKSCGCLKKVMNGKSNTDIGLLLKGMKSRVAPYHSERHLYYDKGIKICDEWLNNFDSFENWCVNNGYKKGLHIDRIDSNKGYNPNNCRFVTPKENANNRCNTYYVNWKGEKISLMMLIDKLGDVKNKYHTIKTRLDRGWDLEKALYKKPGNNYSNRKNLPKVL